MKHFKDLNVSDYIYCINQSIKINVNDIEKDNFNDMVFINEELAIYTHKAYNEVFDWFTRNNI